MVLLKPETRRAWAQSEISMDVLRFHPILKRTLWGGTRLGESFGKDVGDADDVAESWEVSDLSGSESVVSEGEAPGQTIRDLMEQHREDLLGIHADRQRFPLLVKFLDANRDLSVQVHPGKDVLGTAETDLSKAELWVVVEASPDSTISAGLKPDVDRQVFERAVANGTVADCLNTYHVEPGDVIFLAPGTVHSLGKGLLICEIQQPCDITYRIDDWGRVGLDGRRRELHIERGLEAIDFSLGSVNPITPHELNDSSQSHELINNDYFVVEQHKGEMDLVIPIDNRAHVVTMLSGSAEVVSSNCGVIQTGETVILPASRNELTLQLSEDAQLLDAFLPNG